MQIYFAVLYTGTIVLYNRQHSETAQIPTQNLKTKLFLGTSALIQTAP